MENFFTKQLAQRFVNDMNLPIQVINEETFYYWLNLYEHDNHSMTLWKELWEEINEKHGGDVDSFLSSYYDVRDKIIKTVTESDAFKNFNNTPIPSIPQLQPRNKELYNEQNVGKWYYSFDLVKSNIQALNYSNPEILMNSKTYDEFISKFTDSRYISKSKYFRQVVFGQMNPKRHNTLAKYLISKVYKVCRHFGMTEELVSVSSDEIVFEVPENTTEDYMRHVAVTIPILAEKMLCLEVRGTFFRLDGYKLKTDSNPNVCTFYLKRDGNVGWKLKCVPLCYSSAVHKLLCGDKPCEYDLLFQYENKCIAKFIENFSIEEINAKDYIGL